MAKLLIAALFATGLSCAVAAAQGFGQDKPIAAPPEKKPAEPPAPKPADKGPTCRLLTTEAPRGGRLEVEGENFGKAPLVRIAYCITRAKIRTMNCRTPK